MTPNCDAGLEPAECERPIRVVVDGRTVHGSATAVENVPPERLHRAVVGEPVPEVTVDGPEAGPIHDAVGVLGRGDPWLRGALAAAARSRGERAPQREALAAARARLADCEPQSVDLDAARRRLAAASEDEERLRERVATLRGRVDALADAGAETARADAAADLEAAVRELTEAETERIAAEQRLARLESKARSARDRRSKRLTLQDRVGNLERDARAALADRVYDRFRAAVTTLPGNGSAGERPGDYEGDPTLAAVAAVRVANVSAPVVVATDRFGNAAAARRRLDAPVVRVRP